MKSIQNDFNENFNKAIIELDVSSIHDLRVSIKKLRTTFLFLNNILKDEQTSRFEKKTQSLFKSLGKIRDYQVSTGMLKKNKGLKNLKKYFEHKIEIEEKKLKKQFNKLERDEVLELLYRLIIESNKVSNDDIIKRGENLSTDIISDIVKLKKSQLHRTRIYIKRLHHIQTLCRLINPDFTIKEEKKFINLEKQLGKWHDLVILSNHINQFSEKQSNKTVNDFQIDLIKAKKTIEADVKQNIFDLFHS